MAIPVNGWVSGINASLVRYPSPEPITMFYQDSFRFGSVSSVRLLAIGNPVLINKSGFRLIDLELRFENVHDVALIDRIE